MFVAKKKLLIQKPACYNIFKAGRVYSSLTGYLAIRRRVYSSCFKYIALYCEIPCQRRVYSSLAANAFKKRTLSTGDEKIFCFEQIRHENNIYVHDINCSHT